MGFQIMSMPISMSFLFRVASCFSRAVHNCAKRLAKIHLQTHLIVLVATFNGKCQPLFPQTLLWIRHPEQNFFLRTGNHVVSRVVSHNASRSL